LGRRPSLDPDSVASGPDSLRAQLDAREVARAGHQKCLGRKLEDGAAAGLGHNDLLLDAGGGVTVAGRAVGLEGEDHALLDLEGMIERVEAADDRALPQRQADAVTELQAEAFLFVVEAEIL